MIRLTMAQALVGYLAAQRTEIDGKVQPLFAGVWAIFGHGNVAAELAKTGCRANLGWMATPGEDRIMRHYHGAQDGWLEKAAAEQPFRPPDRSKRGGAGGRFYGERGVRHDDWRERRLRSDHGRLLGAGAAPNLSGLTGHP